MEIKERLILALDVKEFRRAEAIVEELKDICSIFKIGPGLFIKYGPDIVKMVQDKGGKVFLDLKLHDIPKTIEKSTKEILNLGVYMFTLHTLGGREMLKASNNILEEVEGFKPISLGVTILTSLKEDELRELGIEDEISRRVISLARMAKEEGIGGVVASPLEVERIKLELGRDFLVVTPGIRMSKVFDDQRRISSPFEAIKKGADFIVVGRPIIEDIDIKKATFKFLEEIERGVRERGDSSNL